MPKPVKAKLSWRKAARQLGVNWSHLYRVVKGERISDDLLRRYKELKRRAGA